LVQPAGLDQEATASFAQICHQLGYLIHYADDPSLASLVVLRPDCLSRAISYVLEDQTTVDNMGLVSHARLALLWSDPARQEDQRYDPAVHPALLRLMEHFDLSYRVEAVGVPNGSEAISLIAQLVPRTAELAGAWEPEDRGPGTLNKVIEIVESSSRRLGNAEGLVFLLIVRLHRLSLGRHDYRKAVHWGGGVVLDGGFNGRALVTVTGPQVRLKVRGAYPQFLMGQLAGEVDWLVESFWKGLDTVSKVPCQRLEPSPCPGLFDVEILHRTKERGYAEAVCPSCTEWQAIDALLLGVTRPSTELARADQVDELLHELTAIRDQDLPVLQSSVEAALSRGDELFVSYLRTLDDIGEHGPRLFTLVPLDPTWRRPGWVKQRFQVTLYCEHSRLPVWVLSGNPRAGVYDIELPHDWVKKAAPVAKIMASVLSLALPAARAIAEIELGEDRWKELQTQVEAAKTTLTSLVDTLAEGLEGAAKEPDSPLPHITEEGEYSGAQLRLFHELLRDLDLTFGGLEKVRNNRRKPLWVHTSYLSVYRPSPPAMPQTA